MNTWNLSRLIRECGLAMRQGLPAGAAIGAVSLAGWLLAFASGGMLAWTAMVLLQVLLACLMCNAQMGGGRWVAASPARLHVHAPVSLLLVGLVLGFLAIMTLLAVTLASLAIRAGAGYDFSAEPVIAEAAYTASPARQLEYVAGLVGILVLCMGIARSIPALAASLAQRRIIALEAFNWTRGQGVRLLATSILVLCLPAALIVAGSLFWGGMFGAPLLSLGLALLAYGGSAVSVAAYRVHEASTLPEDQGAP